jgi:glucose-6-phosphate-specific signal transduction histidine kinase
VFRRGNDTETTVYFCTLETLQNITKYAGATEAAIRLACPDSSLQVTITDDGAGFDTIKARRGSGLQGMADRLPAHNRDTEPVGLEYTIVTVTCYFSQRRGVVRRRSGTRV